MFGTSKTLDGLVTTLFLGVTFFISSLAFSQQRLNIEQTKKQFLIERTETKSNLDGSIVPLGEIRNSKPALMITPELASRYTMGNNDWCVVPKEFWETWAINKKRDSRIGNTYLKILNHRVKELEARMIEVDSRYGLSYFLESTGSWAKTDSVARFGITAAKSYEGTGVRKRANQEALNNKLIAEDALSRQEVRLINDIASKNVKLSSVELKYELYSCYKSYLENTSFSENLESTKKTEIRNLDLLLEDMSLEAKNLRTDLVLDSLGSSTLPTKFYSDRTILTYKDMALNELALLIRAFEKRFKSEQIQLDSLSLGIEDAKNPYRVKMKFSTNYSDILGRGFGHENSPLVAYFTISMTWDSKAKRARVMIANEKLNSYSLQVKQSIENVFDGVNRAIDAYYTAKRKVQTSYITDQPIGIPNFKEATKNYGTPDQNIFAFLRRYLDDNYVSKLDAATNFKLALVDLKNEAIIPDKLLEDTFQILQKPELFNDPRLKMINKSEYLKPK